MLRKIIHIDMDAFFASVEQRDHPELKGKPVAVGGSSNRGVIAAASYEARKFGVRSAMPTSKAKMLCPNLLLVQSNRKAYSEASQQIQAIFHEYTDYVEPLSLDEAFLDVTFPKKGEHSATLLAKQIKDHIWEKTQLTASAGVSYNKFLAKVASDVNKPNGLFVIPPEDALSFLEQLEIEKFFGVGKVAQKKFHELGLFKGKDVKKVPKQELENWFGKAGSYYYNIVRGIDNREVEPLRERKSIGAEQTFDKDIHQETEQRDRLLRIVDRMWKSVEKKGLKGRTLTLKIKFNDFEVITRSRTTTDYIDQKSRFIEEALTIFEAEIPFEKPVRLMGVSLSNFMSEDDAPEQMDLTFYP